MKSLIASIIIVIIVFHSGQGMASGQDEIMFDQVHVGWTGAFSQGFIQDRDGFFWIGIQGALYKWNGIGLTSYSRVNSGLSDAIGRQLGVEYRYADTLQPHVPEVGPELIDEMLSELPPELLAELRHATLVLDRAAMAVLIERIEAHAPDTARGLQRLVDNFQFGRIRDLLGDVI